MDNMRLCLIVLLRQQVQLLLKYPTFELPPSVMWNLGSYAILLDMEKTMKL